MSAAEKMVTAAKLYRHLRGLLVVYKPPNFSINQVVEQINTQFCQELNKLEQRPQKQMVTFKQLGDVKSYDAELPLSMKRFLVKQNITDEKTLVPTNERDWSDHQLVSGSHYTHNDFSMTFGHVLDYEASGVQLVGLQSKGEQMLKVLNRQKMFRKYQVSGTLGLETTTYTPMGKVMSRTTWDHITPTKITRLVGFLGGSHQFSEVRSSTGDPSRHETYLKSAKGLMKNQHFQGPQFPDIELVSLKGPEFVLNVTAANESCASLRFLVHEIGLRLGSCAICTKVRRTSDGIFHSSDPTTLVSGKLGGYERVTDALRFADDKVFNDEDSIARRRSGRHYSEEELFTRKN